MPPIFLLLCLKIDKFKWSYAWWNYRFSLNRLIPIDNGSDVDNWNYEEIQQMVKKFRLEHTSNLVGSEMYDDGFPNSNSDEEVENEVDFKEESKYEEHGDADYPNIDSPRLTIDLKKERSFHVKTKTVEVDEENVETSAVEEEPIVPNEISPGMHRKLSSTNSQNEYEVIGDNAVRHSLSMKSKPSGRLQESGDMKPAKTFSGIGVKYSRTDKGYSEISQMDRKSLSVIVHKGRICKNGFFSFSYPSYTVQLNPVGWIVMRKEQDFIFLRQYLRVKYPQHFIPPLVLTNDKMSSVGLKKKEKYFTRFLINVLRNQDLRGSYFLQEFFQTENQETFEKLMEQRRTEPHPTCLGEYTTVRGKANVKSMTKTWQFWYNIPTFAKEYEVLNHKISSTSKVLVDQFRSLKSTMKELSGYFDDLGSLYSETDENMYDINKSISAVMSSWSDSYESQGKILKNWFPRFYKYNMNEYKSMNEILENRNITKEKFVKMQTELEAVKSKLYADRDFENWNFTPEDKAHLDEIDQDEYLAKSKMLPVQTQNLNDQKLLLNYLNNTLESEIRRVLKYNFKDLKNHFLRIAQQQCQILTNTQICWSDFIVHYGDEREASSDED